MHRSRKTWTVVQGIPQWILRTGLENAHGQLYIMTWQKGQRESFDRGERLVLNIFESLDFTDALAQEVAWMVKSHLVLSSLLSDKSSNLSYLEFTIRKKACQGKAFVAATMGGWQRLILRPTQCLDPVGRNSFYTTWFRSMNSKPAARFRQLSRAENKILMETRNLF